MLVAAGRQGKRERPLCTGDWWSLLLWGVVGLIGLAVVLLASGCARTHGHRASGAPLTTGYDPTWSPDGTKIAYVQAVYGKASGADVQGGIWLDNSEADPAPRQGICIWDLRANKRELIPADPLRKTVITSLVWASDHELLYLVSRIGRGDLAYPAKAGLLHWPSTYRYPILRKDLMVYNLLRKRSSVLSLSPLEAVWGMEPGRDHSGGAILWKYDIPSNALSYMTVTTAGVLGSQVTLPSASWNADPPATARTRVAVGTRDDGSSSRPNTDVKCLSRVYADHYQDFYHPGRAIGGVFGSPDGERVAFFEDSGDHRPAVHMDLKVMPVAGGRPVVAARNAWKWSYVAWSPDGTKIAYSRAEDGRIVIADIPRGREPVAHPATQ